MTHRLPRALALSAALAIPAGAQTVENSRFDAGLAGWTVTPTSASAVGAPGTVETHDIDGAGPKLASPAATFSVGKLPGTPGADYHGVVLSQTVELHAGIEYAFRIDWSSENEGGITANGGRYRILLPGSVIETVLVGGVPAGGSLHGVLEETFTAGATGLATIEIRIDSPATPSSPPTVFHRIDDVRLESGFDSTPGFLSVVAGGVEEMALDAGPDRGGHLYWILGSATGEAPGFDLAGDVHLPLAFDGYLLATLEQPFAPLFGGFLGFLDPMGRASASFHLPAGADPALVGLVLHHAFVTVAPAGGSVSFGSNADSILLF